MRVRRFSGAPGRLVETGFGRERRDLKESPWTQFLRSHPYTPGRYPRCFHQQFMKEFFLFGGLGKFGVSSQGMRAKSLTTVGVGPHRSTCVLRNHFLQVVNSWLNPMGKTSHLHDCWLFKSHLGGWSVEKWWACTTPFLISIEVLAVHHTSLNERQVTSWGLWLLVLH